MFLIHAQYVESWSAPTVTPPNDSVMTEAAAGRWFSNWAAAVKSSQPRLTEGSNLSAVLKMYKFKVYTTCIIQNYYYSCRLRWCVKIFNLICALNLTCSVMKKKRTCYAQETHKLLSCFSYMRSSGESEDMMSHVICDILMLITHWCGHIPNLTVTCDWTDQMWVVTLQLGTSGLDSLKFKDTVTLWHSLC